ncbi:phenylacetic acid degradation operon negative regulatory protein PaaX [Limnohabitans sp.]|uniref:phenylacetic acid degradation operon negative regulatory protein PaaX n=1 Tax=Limnohabitans sp. TaxID=1907725 RepID=UPI00286EDD63|nr:phenylacetic acid degradation operon negative regulatory protein PaaX [Limnohabitans sp.]
MIISVFGDAILPRGGTIWLGGLIHLLEPLGLNERLIRTTVFRLVKDEWLTTQTQGRRTDYKLSSSGWRRFEEASRQIYAANAPHWDNRWRLVMLLAELPLRERERLRRALYWQGFGQMNANCFIHPSADLTSAFDALGVDGMADVLPKLMPLVALNPRLGHSANDSDMIHSAWDLEHLGANYMAFVSTYQSILDALRKSKISSIDEESAFLTRTLLIHDFRRLLLRDPELPEVLLPAKWPGQAARMLCKELYRRLLDPSERHLDNHLLLANGEAPLASDMVAQRFQAGPHVAQVI